MQICTINEIGKKPNQEDSLFCSDEGRIFLICDGMGGHEHGEVASSIVSETVGSMTAESNSKTTKAMKASFENALAKAYEILDKTDSSESERRMGTTLTFLAMCDDGFLVAHIGDSRVYQLRRGLGVVFQTRDHSLVNDLIASGDITKEEARIHPQRNVITRAIQPHQENPARASYKVLTDIREGDVLMLCSDGIVEQIDNEELENILLNKGSLAERCEALKNECKQRETRDNHSCVLIEIDKCAANTNTTMGQTTKKQNFFQRIIKKWL